MRAEWARPVSGIKFATLAGFNRRNEAIVVAEAGGGIKSFGIRAGSKVEILGNTI